MIKKYYLSEMTVSSRHGGGLTLMRVLGDELNEFTNFIRPVPYPVQGFESVPHVGEREFKLWEDPGAFKIKAMPPRFTRPYFSNQIKRLLKMPNPEYIDRHYYRKYYTDYLQKNTDVCNGKYLIVPQNTDAVNIANALYKKFGIPYATWIMDDHLVRYDSATRSYTYPYPRNFEHEFKYHLRNARHVFTISDMMGDFYRRRFGADYSVLFGPADAKEVDFKAKPVQNGILRFCHFGRVWKWPLDAVERFAAQLERLNATLDIFSHYPVEGLLRSNPRVTAKIPVDPSRVTERMKDYHAATIFYGMTDDTRHWSAFNISTKMSECLASGLPVLFVGPEYGAMTEWARKQGCGIVITQPENKDQHGDILRLRDADFAERVSKKCLEVSTALTSTQAMRRIWQQGWDKVLNS